MPVNLHQIRAFSHVLQEGSFSSAARKLGVSQSALTQHVSNLENNVGAQLFLRTHGGVKLTRTGRDFADLSKEFTRIEGKLADKIAQYNRLDAGFLSVIANAPRPALRMIEAFHKTNPDVGVEFSLFDWTTAMSMVRQNEVDAAFITSPTKSEDLYLREIERNRFVLYCQNKHRLAHCKCVSLHDLSREVLLLPEDGSLTGKVVRSTYKKLGLNLRRIVKTTTFPVMKEAILQGVGVGIFLSKSASSEDRLVELPIQEIPDEFTTYLVVPKPKLDLPLLQNFVGTC